jgi:hypothetical protein
MMLEISKEIFGTEDYESVLEVLAPSDALVREFNKRIEKLG